MIFDAIVLCGGRSSRLDGEPKAQLLVEGRSLLQRTLDAVEGARRIVAVGEPGQSVSRAIVAREHPPFAGPASAIAAGMNALGQDLAEFVIVLACDMPAVDDVVVALLEEQLGANDGVIAVDSSGRDQYLTALYRAAALTGAVGRHRGSLENLSVRALLDGLQLGRFTAPEGSTADIDTWADAGRFGIAHPKARTEGATMPENDNAPKMAALADWSRRLCDELGLTGLEVDVDAVLDLASTAAHSVMRPAAPLTTYVVGYAAGLAAGEEGAFSRAAAAAAALAISTARDDPQSRDPRAPDVT